MNATRERVEAAVKDVAEGKLIVVVDDDDRENEGDLIMAASLATPEQVAFMIRHTSGILCTPVTPEEARRLRLDPMVAMNDALQGTAFTVSVDYRFGLTTGISAEERCNTVRALANANAGPEDFVRPGHIFPLIAREGGVLMRSGHTEAGVDLARLAKLPPIGLLAELVNDDGTVKRGQEVVDFAAAHDLKTISVADLIAYRQLREQLVRRVAEFSVETPIGAVQGLAYATDFDEVQHLVLVYGAIGEGRDVLTRLHRENVLTDVFGEKSALSSSLERFKAEGGGVLIYLREGSTGVPSAGLVGSVGDTGGRSAKERERAEQWREIGMGAQIIRDLGISSIRLLATRERQYIGLAGFGIEISETVLI
jgi:3,4-dihydroxy 2-butanone 4-phosphate synthase/GTP cyclohydrolase II